MLTWINLGCPVHFDGDGVEPGFTIRLTPQGARVEPDAPTLKSMGWHCPRCGVHNHRTIAFCLGCEYPRPDIV